MQRKCNLSPYPRKKRVRHCWYCKARLEDQTSLFAYCTEQCLKKSQEPKSTGTPQPTTEERQAEIPSDEWQQAKDREEFEDDSLWVRQTEYWQKESRPRTKRSAFRAWKTEPKPLILTGHGVKLRVDRGALLVRNGFTHHPQKQEEWRALSR